MGLRTARCARVGSHAFTATQVKRVARSTGAGPARSGVLVKALRLTGLTEVVGPIRGPLLVNQHPGVEMRKTKDPLAVERAEMLSMIERLEEVAVGLQDYAGVSQQAMEELKRLRERVAKPPTPDAWGPLLEVAIDLVAKLGAELIVKALS